MGISRKILLPPLIVLFLLSAGCRQEQAKPAAAQSSRRLLIGLVPEESMFKQFARYEPLARYLSDQTGLEIELTVLPRYENLLSSFVSQNMDAAFFGSLTYVRAHRRLGVQAIARPERQDGISTYHGIIITRRDSGIRSVRDMRGKSFAFASRDTIAGYALPLVYFRKAGVVNYKTYLKETYFTGTHEDVIHDVLDRKADIGAAKNTEFERLAEQDPRIRETLWVLALSPEMPENTFAVRKDLDPDITRRLSEALLNMHDTMTGRRVLGDFGALRFIACRESDFQPTSEYAREAGLSLDGTNNSIQQ